MANAEPLNDDGERLLLGAPGRLAERLDDRLVAQSQSRAGRQPEQVDAARGHVLAHLAGRHLEPALAQLVMELGMNEVDLPQIGLRRIRAHAREMLEPLPEMSIPLNPEPGEQTFPVVSALVDDIVAVARAGVA